MSTKLAIVALPRVDDKVNKISSEKKAHMTLLFLGDAVADSDSQAVAEYVQHVAKELSPFGLSVDYRGTLGAEDADVLFFEKSAWDMERIADFRHYLLLDNKIKRAYDSVEQFPEWTPHLTLGYPESPAKELDEDDNGFHYVDFDRIAVWFGDSEGPEFRLKYESRGGDSMMETTMAMSGLSTVEKGALAAAAIFGNDPDSLKQYGKKGMKWGVTTTRRESRQLDSAERRAKTARARANQSPRKSLQNKADAAEKHFEKKLKKLDDKWAGESMIKAHNAMADKMNNGEIDRFNNDPRWKDVDFTDPKNSALNDEYEKAFFDMSDQMYRDALVDLGVSPSGNYRYEKYVDDADGLEYARLVDKRVTHAEGDTMTAFKLVRDELGHISSLEATELELKHYGVKGMKWGVTTKDRAPQADPSAVSVTQKKPGKFAKTEGGKGLPIHEDAERALVARQKAKSSTTDALSNAELQAAVNRMQLETRYSQLEFQSDRRGKGARFIAGLLGQKRYGGKDRKYTDQMEDIGGETRNAIANAMEAKTKTAA